MKMPKMWCTAVLLACSLATTLAQAGDIHLSAAASTKDAMQGIIDGFKKVQPDAKVLTNYGASGALAKQIAQGAPTDLFISANSKWIEFVIKEGKADAGKQGVFAYNTLVFAGKGGATIAALADLKSLQRIAIGTPASVPAGQYAEQAMRAAGVYEQLAKDNKLVMAQDVRQALLYADRGEVDGAFVYKTDALLAKDAKVLLTVPANLYDRISYPMVITTNGEANADAKAFYSYLSGQEAKQILAKFGFEIAP